MRMIAIVDGVADDRLLLRAVLGDLYTVVEYDSERAAVEDLPRRAPDLVLLRTTPPAYHGAQVVALVRGHPQLAHIPVVAVSARPAPEDRARLLALGFDEHVRLPITDDRQLRRTIAQLLPPEGAGA